MCCPCYLPAFSKRCRLQSTEAMPEQDWQLPWEQSGWFEQASVWIQAELERLGRRVTGPIEWVHARVWSVFARAPTSEGAVYFKAPLPAPGFETALTQTLARWRPDCMLPVLAVDLDRGWMLSADAGVTLRSLGQSPVQLEHWHKILPLYVEIQIESVAHPFFTMLVTLRAGAHWLKLEESGLEMARLRDIYLEAWTTFETSDKLRSAFEIAYRLAMVNRSLSWRSGPGSLPEKYKVEYDGVYGWLQDYLEAEAKALQL